MMSKTVLLLASFIALLLWTLCTTTVGAQQAAPDAHVPSEYDQALSQALEAHARGDHTTARTFMERAHELEPSARTLRGLGIVALAQGREREAAEYLEAALASETKPLAGELRDSVHDLLARALAQLTRIELVLDGKLMRVDGAAPVWSAPNVLLLTPGEHSFDVVDALGAPATFRDTGRPGERRTLRILPAPCPATAQVDPRRDVAPARPVAVPTAPLKPLFWSPRVRNGVLIGGAALALASVATYGTAAHRFYQLRDDCKQDGCSEAKVRGRYRGENIEGLAITSGVLAGAASALLIGAGLIELWRYRQKQHQRALSVHYDIGGITLSGSY